jgi:hypothetical protein
MKKQSKIKENNMSKRKIILNRIKTPDGTILTSRNVHDYVDHVDKITNEKYIVDGGLEYLRRSVNKVEAEDMSLYDDSPFEIIRENFDWGTYGKDGKQALKFVNISEMSDSHINALLGEKYVKGFVRELIEKESIYRIENNITITE